MLRILPASRGARELLAHFAGDVLFQRGVATGCVPVLAGELDAAVGLARAPGAAVALGAEGVAQVDAGCDRLLGAGVTLDDHARRGDVPAGRRTLEVEAERAAVGGERAVGDVAERRDVVAPQLPELLRR